MKEFAIFKLYKKYPFLNLKKDEIICKEIKLLKIPDWVNKSKVGCLCCQ